MRFSSAAVLLPFFALANLAASIPISPRQADPSCAPLSKLAGQLSDFEKFSTFILKNAPHDLQRAISDAQKGVASIVSPIDLLNPQVQSLQNTILADLSKVGGEFQKATQANDEGEIVDIAVEIQKILFQRLWPDAVGITALVGIAVASAGIAANKGFRKWPLYGLYSTPQPNNAEEGPQHNDPAASLQLQQIPIHTEMPPNQPEPAHSAKGHPITYRNLQITPNSNSDASRDPPIGPFSIDTLNSTRCLCFIAASKLAC